MKIKTGVGMNQKGSNTTIAVLATLGIIALMAGITGCSMVSSYNDAIRQEQGIVAQYKQNQNSYDNMFKKIQEVAKVPARYAADLKEIFAKTVEGRKGADQEMVRFIQEASPNLDPKTYLLLSALIESSRNAFEAEQKTLLDKVRVYRTSLGIFPNNLVVGFFGFPRIDLDKYDIITSAETATAFETKKAEKIDVFGEKEK